MHLSKGLTHTSSVAMVWGLHTIAGAGSRGKARRDESRVVSHLSVKPPLEFVSFWEEVPTFLNSTLWGCHWKRQCECVPDLAPARATLGHLFLPFAFAWRLGLISAAHKMLSFFHFLLLYIFGPCAKNNNMFFLFMKVVLSQIDILDHQD